MEEAERFEWLVAMDAGKCSLPEPLTSYVRERIHQHSKQRLLSCCRPDVAWAGESS